MSILTNLVAFITICSMLALIPLLTSMIWGLVKLAAKPFITTFWFCWGMYHQLRYGHLPGTQSNQTGM